MLQIEYFELANAWLLHEEKSDGKIGLQLDANIRAVVRKAHKEFMESGTTEWAAGPRLVDGGESFLALVRTRPGNIRVWFAVGQTNAFVYHLSWAEPEPDEVPD